MSTNLSSFLLNEDTGLQDTIEISDSTTSSTCPPQLLSLGGCSHSNNPIAFSQATVAPKSISSLFLYNIAPPSKSTALSSIASDDSTFCPIAGLPHTEIRGICNNFAKKYAIPYTLFSCLSYY